MTSAKISRALLAAFMVLWGSALPEPVCAASPKAFEFTVLLDHKEIGRQSFLVSSEAGETKVEVESSFDVRFLFFTAYRYRHSNLEIWRDGCLRSIESRTDDGGEEFFVRGEYRAGALHLNNREGSAKVEGCVRTYAYWDRSLLAGDSLLNSQTGDMDRVEILELGEKVLPVRGLPTSTEHLRIAGEKFSIDLWYASGGEWVELRSTTGGGKRLRYVIR